MAAADGPIILVPYDPAWPDEFRGVGERLRRALGAAALRIDHVGSTSVPGLDAKPVIDVQLSVARLVPESPYRGPLESLRYRFPPTNPDRTKRFFLNPLGERSVHLHVRPAGCFDEQLNLLLRDYLRTHPEAVEEYARVKWSLSETFRTDREGYVRAKEPTIWALLRRAHDWAQATGWFPGPSDA
jgi:GrpB-like predicted nucleotidyltransferase (UPF0157 family)